ncbi:SRPBCC family protein [Hyunsoonleella aestuarii]|uniref:Effector binding domain-containing protein n=1 Tax=Hyunsoonleella aestuarii TaxID=912802 RepID=A0ABP8ECC3_9FLAO|nr:SRPBCC family protein [Hyunsoonleella aestuarii]
MNAFKYIFFLLLIAIIGTAIYIAVQPDSFDVTRSKTIKAPVSVAYNNVIDYKNWEAWSPWVEKEPSTVITLSEETKGINGSYSWKDKDGVGTMTTTAAEDNKSITQQMQFADFPPSEINWTFTPNDDGTTQLSWSMKGKDLPFGFKAYTAFTGSMDEQVGPDFDRGLEKLDSILIADMKKYKVTVNGLTEHGGGYYLYATTSCKISELESKMQELMPKVRMYATNNNIKMAGAPFTHYHKWDEANNAVMFSACVPTIEKVITTDSDILTGQLEPFKAVKTSLNGNYDNLKEAWETVMKYIPENGMQFAETGPMLEVYLTDPLSKPNPADWITEIYIAVK